MHRTRELMLAREAKAPLAVLRLTAIYGAGDTHNSYGPNRFLRQALKDGRIPLFGNGEETRDHLHVDDAVDLILKVDLARVDGPAQSSPPESPRRSRSVARDDRRRRRAGRSRSHRRRDRIPATHRHFDTTNLPARLSGRALQAARGRVGADACRHEGRGPCLRSICWRNIRARSAISSRASTDRRRTGSSRSGSAANISTARANRAMAATATTGAGSRLRATSPRISSSSPATACSTSVAPRAF